MLYDPKWEGQTNTLSFESLIAWLETMPAARTYNYMNCDGRCLYGQYMRAHGIKWKESGASAPGMASVERDRFCRDVYEYVAEPTPWTFGAALARARKVAGS